MKKNPVQIIVVDADGVLLVSTNGQLGGDQKLINQAKKNVNRGVKVRLVEPFGDLVETSLDPTNPLGITATMMSVIPGRSRILDAPPEVLNWLLNQDDEYTENYPEPTPEQAATFTNETLTDNNGSK